MLLDIILSVCFDKLLPLAIRSLWIWFDFVQSSHVYLSCSFVWNRELHIIHSCSQSIGTGISFELLSSTELTLLLVVSGALSEGLLLKCACKFSPFCRTWSISFGIEEFEDTKEVIRIRISKNRSCLGVHLNIASYGESKLIFNEMTMRSDFDEYEFLLRSITF